MTPPSARYPRSRKAGRLWDLAVGVQRLRPHSWLNDGVQMETLRPDGRYSEGSEDAWRAGWTGRLPRIPLAMSPPRQLDFVTRLAGESLEVGTVCATLVDASGQLVASCYGMDVPTALLVTHALRDHLWRTPDALVVVDAASDPRLFGSPVVRDGTVRACVGIGLGGPDRPGVGSLLLLDRKPRPWEPAQLDFIREIARILENELELTTASARFPGVPAGAPRRVPGVRIVNGPRERHTGG